MPEVDKVFLEALLEKAIEHCKAHNAPCIIQAGTTRGYLVEIMLSEASVYQDGQDVLLLQPDSPAIYDEVVFVPEEKKS